MSEGELWARWWAMAWKQAHPDWYDAELEALMAEAEICSFSAARRRLPLRATSAK